MYGVASQKTVLSQALTSEPQTQYSLTIFRTDVSIFHGDKEINKRKSQREGVRRIWNELPGTAFTNKIFIHNEPLAF
jgi:PAB1-binding protein PBP1